MSYHPKILIVDDEPQICESLKILLARQGYQITAVNSGKKALEALAQNGFDLLLLDMVIPDLSGFEILDHINNQGYNLLVIVITGNASIESAVRALKKGAYDYLRKPFEFEELTRRVGNALNQQRLGYEKKIIDGKLARSEERYQYLVQNSPDIIYMLDKDGNFTFVNLVAEKLLGIPKAQLLGRHFTSIVHEEDIKQAERFIRGQEQNRSSAQVVEMRFLSPAKENAFKLFEVRHLSVHSKPAAAGETVEALGGYGVARDITYRKQLEGQLHQAKKMGAIGTLAGGIAHDFNNILMGIMGYTSLVLSEIDAESPYYAKLKSIEQHVNSGADLTKQLLGFARGGNYDMRSSDINEIIQKTSDMFSRTKKEINIRCDCQEGISPVEIDQNQIEQVLLNLYMNAWQAMPGGGSLITRTRERKLDRQKAEELNLPAGSYVEVAVRDTGTGMDAETVQRVFEPFFTTKEMGRGTGLGLASAYGIIKNHNGAVAVSSEKGVGSTFTLYIPCSGRAPERNSESSGKMLKGTETVLLVDDEKEIIEVEAEILEALGYRVLTAMNGEAAVKLFSENREQIDILIIDMIMPKMSGSEVYDRIRAMDDRVKVLLSSGYSIEGEASGVLARGCNGFIQKPFGIAEISQKIRDVLDSS